MGRLGCSSRLVRGVGRGNEQGRADEVGLVLFDGDLGAPGR